MPIWVEFSSRREGRSRRSRKLRRNQTTGRKSRQAVVYHALGREQDSNAALAELIAKHDTDAAFQIAEVYAFRGQLDKSFEWLERAYKQRDPGLPGLKTDPLLKNVGRDPRFTELLKKMRLPI